MDRWAVGVLVDCLAAHQAGGCWVGINKLYKISDKCITSKKNKNTNTVCSGETFQRDEEISERRTNIREKQINAYQVRKKKILNISQWMGGCFARQFFLA